jgi:hypothetical protein
MDRSVKLTLLIAVVVFVGGLMLVHKECESKRTCGRKALSSIMQQGVTPP